jgi:signal transduction histidine kinase
VLENAIKFSTGTVEVVAHADGASVMVDVIDEGGSGAPGAGLGLAIARGFAGVNDCALSLEPRGGGTVARLTLPATRLPAGIGA